jgi:LPXTG-site transpeptidase (sortase) family protein
MGAAAYLGRAALATLAVLALSLVLQVVIVSRLDVWAVQTRAFDTLRKELAHGVAPTGQVARSGRLVPLGAPVALLTIPELGIREVVLQGTSPEVLAGGPGHLRDTVLPGQVGTSVIFGRQTAYGGPFGQLHRLHVGARFTITTGVGIATFSVIDLRRAGDPLPPALPAEGGRVTLVTATGPPLIPTGVLRVDADLVGGAARAAPPLVITAVPGSQLAMGTDTSNLWIPVLLLEAMILTSVLGVLAWRQWGRAKTWIVFSPIALLLGYFFGSQFTRFLPNLM